MIICTFGISKTPGKVHIDKAPLVGVDPTEWEKRLGQCLQWAVDATMEEVLRYADQGTTLVTKEMVRTMAAKAAEEFLRQHPLEG